MIATGIQRLELAAHLLAAVGVQVGEMGQLGGNGHAAVGDAGAADDGQAAQLRQHCQLRHAIVGDGRALRKPQRLQARHLRQA